MRGEKMEMTKDALKLFI
jgi:hypothetical protein